MLNLNVPAFPKWKSSVLRNEFISKFTQLNLASSSDVKAPPSMNCDKTLQELTDKRVKVDVEEIKRPELDAKLVADSIAEQLSRRVAHKRAMRQTAQRTMRAGADGIMIRVGGRLGGSEMARVDSIREGRIPRHTLRANIDYADTVSANHLRRYRSQSLDL